MPGLLRAVVLILRHRRGVKSLLRVEGCFSFPPSEKIREYLE